jgi:hypothetical protein
MAANRGGPGTQLPLLPDPEASNSARQLGEQPNALAQMAARLNQRLRDSGLTQVPRAPSPFGHRMLIFRMPLPAKPPSPGARRLAISDTELGKWWLDHARYSISYEPLDDGKPGFLLIDRQKDFISWARRGQHPRMQFGDWKAAVRAAMARDEMKSGATP